MTAPTNVQDLFAKASGAPGAFDKDSPVGASVTGTICGLDVRQRNDMDGKPQFWDDGNPQEQLIVTLQTAFRQNADDDGKKRVFIKWWGEDKTRILNAVRAVQAPHLEMDGTLTVTYEGEGEVTRKGLNPPKLYQYIYARPNPAAALMAKANGGNGARATDTTVAIPAAPPAAPPPAPQRQPEPATPAPAAAAVDGNVDGKITMIQTMGKQGLSAGQIHSVIPDVSMEVIAAVLALA